MARLLTGAPTSKATAFPLGCFEACFVEEPGKKGRIVELLNVMPGRETTGALFNVLIGNGRQTIHSSKLTSPDGEPFPESGKSMRDFVYANCVSAAQRKRADEIRKLAAERTRGTSPSLSAAAG